ncbi:2'-5' RNA ligase family protein [Qipengyuania sp. XHP0211]|uniref:2'-5' RNA ligase family protein n=1 Tax=Qipengyuania sp. XHP0211 TaxID=3038079 RepID=UPI00241C0EF4|nr:2'-5' RNA ligase family protein [Qipengyuania sp. XHP0211]MDG5749627.1 2'-5' RNA ligase family protein [Qipengyuania sp. XHP0211]
MSEGDASLILTAQLPDDMHARYTALRDAHFPPERNYLEAHVTLFHALPGMCEGEVVTVCERMARDFAPVPGKVVGLMSLGRGTAIKLESLAMLRLRDLLADGFHGLLTQQDQHRPRLHVTIQNKVSGKEAKALQAQLDGTILPRNFTFPGLSLFHYRGGPWEHVKTFAFRGKDTA